MYLKQIFVGWPINELKEDNMIHHVSKVIYDPIDVWLSPFDHVTCLFLYHLLFDHKIIFSSLALLFQAPRSYVSI